MLVLPFVFAACTEPNEGEPQKPNDTPTDQPGDQPETPGDEPETPGDEPEVQEIVFEALDFIGGYYGDIHSTGAGLYSIVLSDNGLNDTDLQLYSTYYCLDVYAELYGGEGDVKLPEGTYTLDLTSSKTLGTISHNESGYFKLTDKVEASMPLDAAELVVTSTTTTLVATIGGAKHTVTFNGQATISDQRPQDVVFEANNAWAYYYGGAYSYNKSDNFLIGISDIDYGYNDLPNAVYYRLDLFSDFVADKNDPQIPYGTYTFDTSHSFAPLTIDVSSETRYMVINASGTSMSVSYITGGSVTIDENGLNAEFIINGAKHTVTYKGNIFVEDYSDSILQ